MPIKYVIGDYFLTELDKKLFCFKIDATRQKTYRQTLVKSFRVLQYDTTHYLPISGGNLTELENVLRKNSLPNIDGKMFGLMKLLSKREKAGKDFTPHDIQQIIEEVSANAEKYPDDVENITQFLNNLKTEQIVTPVKKLTEFLEGEVMTSDPKFFGDIARETEKLEIAHKKVTNQPITGKTPWLKVIAILSIIGLMGGIGYLVYSSGMLNNITPNFSQFNGGGGAASSGPPTESSIMAKYPTPESLKAAIDRGDIKMSDLPKNVQDMVKTVKTPVAAPQH